MNCRILVIDGMGGRIGQEIVQRFRSAFGERVDIVAIGTNSTATSAMLKAGANRAATGENAVRMSSHDVDVLVCPLSVLIPNSMMGEVTPAMAEALSLCGARKVILPLTNPRIDLVGTTKDPLPHLLDEVTAVVASLIDEGGGDTCVKRA